MTHSPGPWAAYDNAAYGTAIKSNQTNKYVANVHMYAGLSVETYQANARLIAAAPKMLGALEKVAEFIRDQYECHEAQALEGGYLSKEAEPIWAIISEAIADARAGESDAP